MPVARTTDLNMQNKNDASKSEKILPNALTKELPITDLKIDGGTQIRVELNEEYVAALQEAWLGGAKIPDIVAFFDGSVYWLADGFHRYHAARRIGLAMLSATVITGTRQDAVKYALGANATHGLRRTNADKRHAVEIALKEFALLSSRQIAEICAVGDDMVNELRVKVSENDTSERRTGADGKTYPAKPAPTFVRPAGNLLFSPPKQRPKLASVTITPQGLFIADVAINNLAMIPPDDPLRIKGLTKVRDWCAKQLQ